MHKLTVFILCLALIFTYGCTAETAAPSDAPAVTPSAAPSASLSAPSAPAAITSAPTPSDSVNYKYGRPVSDSMSLEVDGIRETIAVTLIYGDFGDGNKHTVFSMYADLKLYNLSKADGVYTLSSGSGVYMEIKFTPDQKAESIVPPFMDDYIDYTDIEFTPLVPVEGSGLYGYYIESSSKTDTATAYLIDCQHGTLSVVMVYPTEAVDGHGVRMDAMVDTLEIYE